MPRAMAPRASRATVHRSCEMELRRAKHALQRYRLAIAEEEAGAILRRRPANERRAGHASFAPSPTDPQAEATDGGQHFSGRRSCALTRSEERRVGKEQ